MPLPGTVLETLGKLAHLILPQQHDVVPFISFTDEEVEAQKSCCQSQVVGLVGG